MNLTRLSEVKWEIIWLIEDSPGNHLSIIISKWSQVQVVLWKCVTTLIQSWSNLFETSSPHLDQQERARKTPACSNYWLVDGKREGSRKNMVKKSSARQMSEVKQKGLARVHSINGVSTTTLSVFCWLFALAYQFTHVTLHTPVHHLNFLRPHSLLFCQEGVPHTCVPFHGVVASKNSNRRTFWCISWQRVTALWSQEIPYHLKKTRLFSLHFSMVFLVGIPNLTLWPLWLKVGLTDCFLIYDLKPHCLASTFYLH